MSKTLKIAFAILLTICAGAMAQQEKPKLAVVVDGSQMAAGKKLSDGAYKQFSGQIVTFITKRYDAVDRSAQALNLLGKEHDYQRSGHVDDEQIQELGKQLGVHYLCIVSITWSVSDYYLEAKLMDVKTAVITNAFENSSLGNSNELTYAAKSIADQLLGSNKNTQQYSNDSRSSISSERASEDHKKGGKRFGLLFEAGLASFSGEDVELAHIFGFGLTSVWPLAANMSLEVNALYSIWGTASENSSVNVTVTGIDVPVMFRYGFGEVAGGEPYIGAGVKISFPVSGEFEFDEGLFGTSGTYDFSDDLNAMELSLIIGGGVQINSWLFGLKYFIAVTDFVSEEGGGGSRNGFVLDIGYLF